MAITDTSIRELILVRSKQKLLEELRRATSSIGNKPWILERWPEDMQYATWNKDGCRACGSTTAKPYIWVSATPVVCAPCWQHWDLSERLTFMRGVVGKDQKDWEWWSSRIWLDAVQPQAQRR